MNDTDDDVAKRYVEMLRRVSPEARLAMGARMLGTARTLARAGIVERVGDDEVAVRRELFLRFYGREIREPHRSRALARIELAAREGEPR